MKRLFFVCLFALTALWFTACSSDDDNGAAASFPSAESSIAFPTPGDTDFAPSQFASSSRYVQYAVGGKEYNDHYTRLAKDSTIWTCSTDTSGNYDRSCNKIPVSGIFIYYSASFRVNDGEPTITLSVSNTVQSATLPDIALFNEFAITGTELSNGYTVAYDFGNVVGNAVDSSNSRMADFQAFYTSKLVKEGFEEDPTAPDVYKKASTDEVYAYGVSLTYSTSPNYTATISASVEKQKK
jgi:hypothetical protein